MSNAERAVQFVNLLVPGRFDEARGLLSPHCEYQYGGETLRGNAVVDAFEESHRKAAAELDAIEYLRGVVDELHGDEVVVRVFDRISCKGNTHTYSDRLAVTLGRSGGDWCVTRIEHRPFPQERESLKAFLNACGIVGE